MTKTLTLQTVYNEFKEMGVDPQSDAMVHLEQFVKLFNESLGEIIDIKASVDKQLQRYKTLGWVTELPELPK